METVYNGIEIEAENCLMCFGAITLEQALSIFAESFGNARLHQIVEIRCFAE